MSSILVVYVYTRLRYINTQNYLFSTDILRRKKKILERVFNTNIAVQLSISNILILYFI